MSHILPRKLPPWGSFRCVRRRCAMQTVYGFQMHVKLLDYQIIMSESDSGLYSVIHAGPCTRGLTY